MSINQLADEGSVIGYRPNLQYVKEKNGDGEANSGDISAQNAENLDKTTEISYSSAVQSFIESNPSSTISKLKDSISYINNLVDGLTKAFQEGDWDNYGDISMLLGALESGNSEFYNKFVEYHSKNPGASIIPEIIVELYGQKSRVQTLIQIVKELFYGKDNISLEECAEYDTAHIQQIKTYEELGQEEKINYLAVAMDAMLCRNIGMHSYGINKKASKLAKIGTSPDDSFVSTTGRDTVTSLYDEINAEIDSRKQTYKTQNDVAVVQQALYNYYNKRKATILVSSLFAESNENIALGRRLTVKQDELHEAIANVARAVKSNELYLSKMAELEYEKRFLMNVYSRFNYNLENT